MPRKGRSSWLNTLDSTRYLISMENYRFLCYRIDYHGPFNEMSSSCVPEQAIWQGADPILPFSILRFPGVWANLILPVLLSGVMVHLPHTFFNGSYVFFTLCFVSSLCLWAINLLRYINGKDSFPFYRLLQLNKCSLAMQILFSVLRSRLSILGINY